MREFVFTSGNKERERQLKLFLGALTKGTDTRHSFHQNCKSPHLSKAAHGSRANFRQNGSGSRAT